MFWNISFPCSLYITILRPSKIDWRLLYNIALMAYMQVYGTF